MKNKRLSDSMITSHLADDYDKHLNAIVPPIYMNSLHIFDTIEDYYAPGKEEKGIYLYGRVTNPTVEVAERKVAALENASRAFLYASGMAAATAAILSVCKAGDHVICVHNAYGPVQGFLKGFCAEHMNIRTTFVRGDRIEEIQQAITSRTTLLLLESPGTATFSIVDLSATAKLAKENGITTYIDNSYCTPLYQKPLDLGIDIVMHTATKYLGGHSDVLGGVLCVNDKALADKLFSYRMAFGGNIGPMEAWLITRGLRTLGVRLKQHEEAAMKIAAYLEKHGKIKKVYYPGLKSHPQYHLAKQQQTGNCGLLSFEIDGDVEAAKRVVNALTIFKIGPSWGGFESLVTMPLLQESDEYAEWYGGSRNLIRIHCGLEGVTALKKDLNQALNNI